MTLVEFLRARYDEDEREAAGDAEFSNISGVVKYARRVLADIEAKRRIIDAHARPHECISLTGRGERSVVDGKPWELWEPEHTDDHGPCFVLRCLALPYDWHDDYRQEWRP